VRHFLPPSLPPFLSSFLPPHHKMDDDNEAFVITGMGAVGGEADHPLLPFLPPSLPSFLSCSLRSSPPLPPSLPPSFHPSLPP